MITFLKQQGNSKIQEMLAEYAFLKDLLTDGIRNNVKVLISRSDFDAFGYDLLAQIEGTKTVIKLQIKAVNGKASTWDVHRSLLEDEDGNVVVIKVTEQQNDLSFEYYSILNNDRNRILAREPKKSHLKKCKLIKGDLALVSKYELLQKIFNHSQ